MNNFKSTTIFTLFVTLVCLQATDSFAAKTKKASKPAAKAAAAATPTPAASPSATPVASPTATPAPSPTATPVPSPTAAPTATPEPTPAVEATPTPAPAAAAAESGDSHKDSYGKKNRPLGQFQVGPYVTLVSIPRPISFGAEAKWIDLIGVSGSYGFFPQVKISSVSLKITGYDARLKIYPFRGSFYLGVGFGSQTLTASSVQTVSGIPVTANISQKNNFIAPQLGWNWVWDSGFFMGLDLGVQLSSSRTTTFTSDVADAAKTTPEYLKLEKDINDMANLIGKTPLPLLTFIKVGYFF